MLRDLARCVAVAVIGVAVFAAVCTARRLGIGACVRCGRSIVPWAYRCGRCGRPPAKPATT